MDNQRVHFIAIGGAAMHNLAIALHQKGCNVTGSDDELFEPSRGRLKKYGLLPDAEGWHPEKITSDIDAVILGMHAKADNLELIRAKELGLNIYSYPEFLFEASKNKKRIVIGGSHGKTTITSMIIHVFQHAGIDFDYMVGAQLEGFEVMVRLSDAPVMIFEGDEYLTSALDKRPKFHIYRPHIALISGIAWDHINVFPTQENYKEQFRKFIEVIEPNGILIYCMEDKNVCEIAATTKRSDIQKIPYSAAKASIENNITVLQYKDKKIPLRIFGKHNLMNLEGAHQICYSYGVEDAVFYEAMRDFKGASNRLETVFKNDCCVLFKDFAHSASKVKATIEAVKNQYPNQLLIACLELHTYSSLNEKFLPQYYNSMADADNAFVYFNPHAIALKKLPIITPEQIKQGFGTNNIEVFTDANLLWRRIKSIDVQKKTILMMSSGNFNGKNIEEFI
jgi:UDP-N-acetylmuramate: L-alanyl-gamma-D-glutamyl-meso-diaminopimelate ligase